MTKMDDILALDRGDLPPPLPFFTCDPIVVSDEVQAWPLDQQRCLWWLRPSVGDVFIRFVARQQLTIVTDTYQEVVQRWTALRRELYT